MPKWFPPATWLILLWMLVGVMMFVQDIRSTPDTLAALPDAMRELLGARPGWLFIVYGTATGAGAIGALALVARQGWSVYPMMVSLLAVTVQVGYTMFGTDAIEVMGAGQGVAFPLLIFAMGVLSLWVAVTGKHRNWLR